MADDARRPTRARAIARPSPCAPVLIALLLLGLLPIAAVGQAARSPSAAVRRHLEAVERLARSDRTREAAAAARRAVERAGRDRGQVLLVASRLNAAGMRAYTRSQIATAQAIWEEAVAITNRHAPDSLDAARYLNNLGLVAFNKGNYVLARTYWKRSLTIRARDNRESLEVALTLANLGAVESETGNLETARTYHLRCLSIRQKQAPNSSLVAWSLNNLGSVAQRTGDWAAARDYLTESLALRLKLPYRPRDVAASLEALGVLARAEGKFSEAKYYLERAYQIKNKERPGTFYVATTLNNLGLLAMDSGDLEAARDYHARSHAINARLLPGSLDVATNLNNLGVVAAASGDFRLARRYYDESLAIKRRVAPNSLSVAEAWNNLGALAYQQRSLGDAHDLFVRALAIAERPGASSDLLRTLLDNLARVCEERGEVERATALRQRARATGLRDPIPARPALLVLVIGAERTLPGAGAGRLRTANQAGTALAAALAPAFATRSVHTCAGGAGWEARLRDLSRRLAPRTRRQDTVVVLDYDDTHPGAAGDRRAFVLANGLNRLAAEQVVVIRDRETDEVAFDTYYSQMETLLCDPSGGQRSLALIGAVSSREGEAGVLTTALLTVLKEAPTSSALRLASLPRIQARLSLLLSRATGVTLMIRATDPEGSPFYPGAQPATSVPCGPCEVQWDKPCAQDPSPPDQPAPGGARGARLLEAAHAEIGKPESVFGRRYAVLFANNTYAHWPRLDNPERDANEMARVLKDDYGFETEVVAPFDLVTLRATLARYQRIEYAPNDQLIVFIAGHGHFDQVAGEGLLVGKETPAPADTPLAGYPLMFVSNALLGSKCRHILVLLDTCFGGTFDRRVAGSVAPCAPGAFPCGGGVASGPGGGQARLSDAAFVKWARTILSRRTRRYLASGGKTYVPDGRPGGHSPFAARLLERLKAGAPAAPGYLTFSDLKSAVRGLDPEPFGDDFPDGDPVRGSERNSEFILLPNNYSALTGIR